VGFPEAWFIEASLRNQGLVDAVNCLFPLRVPLPDNCLEHAFQKYNGIIKFQNHPNVGMNVNKRKEVIRHVRRACYAKGMGL